MTLAQIRAAIRQRCNMENSAFISDAEFTSYINQSYFELYDLLVQEFGGNYYVAPPLSLTTDGIASQYALPDGVLYSGAPAIFKLLGVDLQVGTAQERITLKPFNFAERNKFSTPNILNAYGVTALRYNLNGSNILFTPLPAGGQILYLWYVPRMTTLSSESDVVDGVSGWTEYIINDCCIKALTKEESDAAVFLAQKQALIKRIESAAEHRDIGAPPTVSDSRNDWNSQYWYDGVTF
jgi:hypothetical protein